MKAISMFSFVASAMRKNNIFLSFVLIYFVSIFILLPGCAQQQTTNQITENNQISQAQNQNQIISEKKENPNVESKEVVVQEETVPLDGFTNEDQEKSLLDLTESSQLSIENNNNNMANQGNETELEIKDKSIEMPIEELIMNTYEEDLNSFFT
ncbi:MAG: hypothetical protein QXF76_00895 [Candidatus Anstonellales archaeon]